MQGPPHDPGLSFRSVAELFRIINFERIDYEYKVCERHARVCARTRAIGTIRTALRAALCSPGDCAFTSGTRHAV